MYFSSLYGDIILGKMKYLIVDNDVILCNSLKVTQKNEMDFCLPVSCMEN